VWQHQGIEIGTETSAPIYTSASPPASLSGDTMKEGVGRNSRENPRSSASAPSSSSRLLSVLSFFPRAQLPLRHLPRGVFLSRAWNPPPHINGGQEVQDRLAAPLIGEVLRNLTRFLPLAHLARDAILQTWQCRLPAHPRPAFQSCDLVWETEGTDPARHSREVGKQEPRPISEK
jgi:hypothetical protein